MPLKKNRGGNCYVLIRHYLLDSVRLSFKMKHIIFFFGSEEVFFYGSFDIFSKIIRYEKPKNK